MTQIRIRFLLLAFLSLSGIGLNAQTKLPSILSDNMCLQQSSDVKIWGWDTPGQSITVKPSWTGSSKTVTDNDGNWLVTIRTPEAGGSYKIKITGSSQHIINNMLTGEVWLCSGQSNMDRQLGFRRGQKPIVNFKEESENANFPKIRMFKIENRTSDTPLNDCNGKWVECSPETALEFSAVGFFYGKALYKALSIPVGLIQSSWGGTRVEAWTKREDFDKGLAERYSTLESCYQLDSSYYYRAVRNYKNGLIVNQPKMPESVREHNRGANRLSVLYNGMISPIINYTIKGAIWYQGESNRSNWKEYKVLFPGMIESWREKWNIGDFPFFFVQIAPYNYGEEYAVPQIVEAQCEALKLPNTGVAATQDIASFFDIHPPHKEEVGRRLSLIALNQTYGKSDIVFSGPVLSSYKNEGESFVLQFDTPDSELYSSGVAIGGIWAFYIAGEDKIFYKAGVKLDGNRIILSTPKVKHPVAARYNWSNNANSTIYNTHGLPALPFRTDDWDEVIYGE